MKNKEKLIEIDILKCGILLIILCHLRFFLSFQISHYPVEALASTGLSMFVFASGYTIASRYINLKTQEDIYQYFKKRVIRIYPIWWIGLFFWIIVFGILKINSDTYTENFSVIGLIYLFTGVHGFFKGDGGHLEWFVGTILIYYVIYAIIAKYAHDDTDVFIIALGIYFICSAYRILDPRFYIYYPVFLFGILAGKHHFFSLTNPYFLRIPMKFQGIIHYIAESSFPTYMIHAPILSLVEVFNIKLKVPGFIEICVVLVVIPLIIIIGHNIQNWVSEFNYRAFNRSLIRQVDESSI